MKSLGVLLLLVTVSAAAQKHQYAGTPNLSSYAVPTLRAARILHMLDGDPRAVFFTLTTSWIPADGKGSVRYKLNASVAKPSFDMTSGAIIPPGGWDTPLAVKRLHSCDITLALYDEGGFVLQKIPVVFLTSVNDDDVIEGLSANDTARMSLDEYRHFLAADSHESWNILWACPTVSR